ncbi:MAG: cysteine desulfurase family protein [Pseudomonadota bacterium]
MTGLDGDRVYLDWNATAPLRPEARQAMLEAMDAVGNPSSVHAEGRAAKSIVERARRQVAALVGCEPDEVVFTSGATEAIEHALSNFHLREIWLNNVHPAFANGPPEIVLKRDDLPSHVIMHSGIEHDAVARHEGYARRDLKLFKTGQIAWGPFLEFVFDDDEAHAFALQSANSETGVLQNIERALEKTSECKQFKAFFSDTVQSVGKRAFSFGDSKLHGAAISSHKLGGPKGSGALLSKASNFEASLIRGGGQEQGRRSGTENVIGIAGFGAAAEAARRDLEAGVWDRVEKLRNILENTLVEAAPETIFFGKESPRLPNTSCFAVPGWKGETQVMQMDLAGFAISAGSACSSGKVNKASRVLLAMGFDEITASSAIRVSLGPTTTEAEVLAFADAWKDAYRRRKARAA